MCLIRKNIKAKLPNFSDNKKCCLFNNLDSFILWCNENNSCLFKFNKTNTFSFIDLIKDNCKDKNLFKNMKYIKSCNDKKNIKLHSFRMAFTDIF